MALEIERKFIVVSDEYKKNATKNYCCQGYLLSHPDKVVRVRIYNNEAYLTIKGRARGISRSEFEYAIPLSDANILLSHCEKPIIEKYRYTVTIEGFTWEVDEFLAENAGLTVAEIELEYEDQPFPKPSWIGKEVSQDSRYFNSNLIHCPYNSWNK